MLDQQTQLERLVAQVPRPRANLLTYHGILAPAASWRERVVPAPPPKRTNPPPCEHGEDAAPLESTPTRSRHERYTWAELMRRVYKIEVLTCEKCGAKRTLLAVVTDPDEVRRFLTHLGLPTRAPPITPAPTLFDEPI